MSEGEYQRSVTPRNLRKVRVISLYMAGLAVKDPLTMANSGYPATMVKCNEKFDTFLLFNERNVLIHAQRTQFNAGQKLVVKQCEVLCPDRYAIEALAAGEADFADLEKMRGAATNRKKDNNDD